MGSIMPDLAHPTAAMAENGQVTNSRSSRARGISRATMYMILYPLIYILSTLPLGAGRISSMVGNHPSPTYLVVAGCLMACGGWMNCLVYSLTRRIFYKSKPTGHDPRRTPSGGGKDSILAVAIEMSASGSQNPTGYPELLGSVASKENIVAVGKKGHRTNSSDTNDGVTMERTWEVKTEEVKPSATVSKENELGYHTYVSHLEGADIPGVAPGIT